MGLLDELKKQVNATEDIAKLKTAESLVHRRIEELEATVGETPAEVEAPTEEAVEQAADMPDAPSEEEQSQEEPVEEAPPPVKRIVKPAPKPAPAKAPPKPKFAVGMPVYGVPTKVNFAVGDYRKGDRIAFEAKIEKIDLAAKKAIILYTDRDRSKAVGGNPPKRVWAPLDALEPIPAGEDAATEAADDQIPQESD